MFMGEQNVVKLDTSRRNGRGGGGGPRHRLAQPSDLFAWIGSPLLDWLFLPTADILHILLFQ